MAMYGSLTRHRSFFPAFEDWLIKRLLPSVRVLSMMLDTLKEFPYMVKQLFTSLSQKVSMSSVSSCVEGGSLQRICPSFVRDDDRNNIAFDKVVFCLWF